MQTFVESLYTLKLPIYLSSWFEDCHTEAAYLQAASRDENWCMHARVGHFMQSWETVRDGLVFCL